MGRTTPHLAGASGSLTPSRISANAAVNLSRYLAKEPLQNVVKI
jgi:phosphoglycerate dehydrogenase-like enzyme